jgi:hypothetical protein
MIESDKRSLNDIKQLKEILCDVLYPLIQVEALKKLQSTSELDYICRELALIRLKNSEFVFQKDKGKLYIILQGSVGIYTRDEAILDEVHTLTASNQPPLFQLIASESSSKATRVMQSTILLLYPWKIASWQ